MAFSKKKTIHTYKNLVFTIELFAYRNYQSPFVFSNKRTKFYKIYFCKFSLEKKKSKNKETHTHTQLLYNDLLIRILDHIPSNKLTRLQKDQKAHNIKIIFI